MDKPRHQHYRTVVRGVYEIADEVERAGLADAADRLRELARDIGAVTPNYARIWAAVPEGLLGDAVKLLEALDVRYAVIGGIAVDVWGTASETDDVDILVEPELSVHAARLADKEFMGKFGFRKTKSHTGTVWCLDGDVRGGAVELLAAVDAVKKKALERAEKTQNVLGEFMVVSALDVVLLKAVASTNSPSRLNRDTRHAVSVIHAQHLDEDAVLAEAPEELRATIRHFFERAS